MLDKKILRKNLIILLLVIVIGISAYGIIRTLARYNSSTETTDTVDIAFWFVEDGFEEETLYLEDIVPSESFYEIPFSISNNNGTKTADTDIEYEIDIKATTNLPLNYYVYKKVSSAENINENDIYTAENEDNYAKLPLIYSQTGSTTSNYYSLIQDDDNTYYKNTIYAFGTDNNKLTMKYTQATTENFVILVEFPISYKNKPEYQDLVEYIQLGIKAKQIIDE